MAGTESSDTILKVLSGLQSGVDVALVDGDYTLGSGEEDDIKLLDVSLKPGHAKLSIKPGKIELAGAGGALRTRNGLTLEAGGAFQEIEPLDIVTAGTTRFALGPRTANWASIADAEAEQAPPLPGSRRPAKAAAGKPRAAALRSWRTMLPVGGLILLVGTGFVMASFLDGEKRTTVDDVARSDLQLVRSALGGFVFAQDLDVRQEVDGTVYVKGFVDTPVERRAVVSAVRETEVPARVRVSVLELIRNEVANLISSEELDLTYELSDNGALTLRGIILEDARAAKVAALVEENVIGISSFNSEIRTAQTMLAEVQALAEKSQITPLVLLRLTDNLIEASGVLPTRKIDAWVGFLQAYSSSFADKIPLRSLVQLQNPDGTIIEAPTPDAALYLGNGGAAAGDIAFDIDRLRRGDFDLADIFVGQDRAEAEAGGSVGRSGPAADEALQGSGDRRLDLRKLLAVKQGSAPGIGSGDGTHEMRSGTGALENGTGDEGDMSRNSQGMRVVGSGSFWAPDVDASSRLRTDGASGPSEELRNMAEELIERWQDDTLEGSEGATLLKKSMDALSRHRRQGGAGGGEAVIERYQPLLARPRVAGNLDKQCWRGSTLSVDTVMGTLFWLDLFSVSSDLSIVDVGPEFQRPILEAALNPEWTSDCAATAAGSEFGSVYLYEIMRNSDFVRHIARDLTDFPIDVAGASTVGKRYIQTRSGRKMSEGAAPDASSRLAMVGQLGVAVEQDSGYAKVIFDADLNWLIR